MLMTDGDDELDSMAEDSLNNETDLHLGASSQVLSKAKRFRYLEYLAEYLR